jgi:hypothetical protein
MTESSTYAPALSRVRVDAQATRVAIKIRSTKKLITIVLFLMAVTPLCKFVIEWLVSLHIATTVSALE